MRIFDDVKHSLYLRVFYYTDNAFLVEFIMRFRLRNKKGRWGRKIDLPFLVGPFKRGGGE